MYLHIEDFVQVKLKYLEREKGVHRCTNCILEILD